MADHLVLIRCKASRRNLADIETLEAKTENGVNLSAPIHIYQEETKCIRAVSKNGTSKHFTGQKLRMKISCLAKRIASATERKIALPLIRYRVKHCPGRGVLNGEKPLASGEHLPLLPVQFLAQV